jgi:hypothetical protein
MTPENPRQHKWYGKLYPDEIELARAVFGETIPYERVFIADTETRTQGITLATSPRRTRAKYLLLWSEAYRANIALADEHMQRTFIHELVHVWQSQHTGLTAMSYMGKSVWHQFTFGVRDMYQGGLWDGTKRMFGIMGRNFTREWGRHRNRAYMFDPENIGADFRVFNVEQQALIIESWYSKQPFFVSDVQYLPGFQSEKDSRFPYIRDCLRAENPKFPYIR